MIGKLPSGSCDCHIHIYGPADKYPEAPTAAFPAPDAPVEAYRAVRAELGNERVVVVQPSAYGTDNRRTVEAIAELGPGARGVAMVRPDVSVSELRDLGAAGIRGVRLHMLLRDMYTWNDVEPVARSVHEAGMHVEIQMDGRDLPEREALIRRLPCNVVIDHVGKFLEPVRADHPAFQTLLRLLQDGHVWVKLSAPYETSRQGAPDYSDVADLARALVTAAPERLVWASNWPHPSADGDRPDDRILMETIVGWMGPQATRRQILVDNPAELYRF